MRSFAYIFYNFFYKYLLKLYLKHDTRVKHDGFKLKVLKGVFHPKLFFSTSYLYSFLKNKKLNDKKFLEIGAGSGILSMLAYKKGASVTATDIDPAAVENTLLNFSSNFRELKNVKIIQSDLFENIRKQEFDFIVINPPYYFKKVEVSGHYAWYCGENGEYFVRLFAHLKSYMAGGCEVYMVLEENCDIDRIKNIARANAIFFEKVHEKRIKWEMNFIFRLT